MPHLTLLYSPSLEAEADMQVLCRKLGATMQAVRDEAGQPVFPLGGIRVLACPATHDAVGDGSPGLAFCYFNLRMARGRSEATQQAAGQALVECAKAHFAPVLARRTVGLTLQVDEGHEVFDAKFGNLHAHFLKA